MNKALLIALALLCCAGFAFAQPPGAVAVYADDGYGYMNPSSCEIADYNGVPPTAPVYLTFHFVHVADNQGATAVEFQCDMTALTIGLDLGDISPFSLKIGNFRTGTSISYGSCLPTGSSDGSGAIYLGSTTIRHPGNMKHLCAYMYVKNHPVPGIENATTPLAVGCPTGWVVLRGSYAVVSYDHTNCHCRGTIPTEESSWGQIKALYE